jgi:hypothetical protein
MKALDYGFEAYGNTLHAKIGNGATWSVELTTTLSVGQWQHVTLTYDGAEARFLVDGQLVQTGTGVHTTNDNPLLFGSWDTGSEFFDGTLDEIGIWNRVLATSEIQSLVTGTPPDTTSSEVSATPQTDGTLVAAIDAGGGAAGSFASDANFSGGNTYSIASTIDTSAVTNPAPPAVYQTERYGNFTYTIPNLTPGAAYTVRLHFAEIYWNSAGSRLFNVAINGAPVLNNFDIFAAARAKNIALVRQFSATPDSSGRIIIQFTTIIDNAKLSGIEILTAS